MEKVRKTRNHKKRVSNKEKETSSSCTNSVRSRASINVSLATILLENTEKLVCTPKETSRQVKELDVLADEKMTRWYLSRRSEA